MFEYISQGVTYGLPASNKVRRFSSTQKKSSIVSIHKTDNVQGIMCQLQKMSSICAGMSLLSLRCLPNIVVRGQHTTSFNFTFVKKMFTTRVQSKLTNKFVLKWETLNVYLRYYYKYQVNVVAVWCAV